MKKDFQCDFNYKRVYSLLLAAYLLSVAKLKLNVHHAIKRQQLPRPLAKALQPTFKTLQHLFKIHLRTLLNQQPVADADVKVADISWVADADVKADDVVVDTN